MDPRTALQQAQHLIEVGRHAEAEGLVRRALLGSPDDAGLHVALARALLGQQRYVEARDAAGRALRQDPDGLNALAVLGAALAGEGRHPEALDVARRGQALAPDVPLFHRQEGMVLLSQEQPAQALAPLGRARGLDPQDADTAALLAATHLALRRFDEAEACVTQALALDPQSAEAHRVRGMLSLYRGGGRQAVASHREALRLDPQSQAGREQLAVAMKTRNPLYGALVRFGLWLETLPQGARFAILLSPLLANRLLRPFDDQLWAQVLTGLLVALVVLSWALEPLMNVVLLASRFGRSLMSPDMKAATVAFLGYALAAAGVLALWFPDRDDWLLLLAVGLGIWGLVTGQLHLFAQRRRTEALVVVGVGAALSVIALVATLLSLPGWTAAVVLVLLGSLGAMLWSLVRG